MQRWTGNHGGARPRTLGFVLHATRGSQDDPDKEYTSTLNWFTNPSSEASSTIVISHTGEICEMVPLATTCWTTGEQNASYAAVEIAQARLNGPITEAQMRSLAWYLRNVFFPAYPHLKPSAATLPFHSELPSGIRIGKSDLFSRGDPKGIAWRERLIEMVKG